MQYKKSNFGGVSITSAPLSYRKTLQNLLNIFDKIFILVSAQKSYAEPSQTSRMELLAKGSILDA